MRTRLSNPEGGGKSAKRIRTETELFDKMTSRLYSPVISDILDELGFRNHTMNIDIRPLRSDMVLSGRAAPVLMAEGRETSDNPYQRVIGVIDHLSPGQVPVIATSDCRTTAVWGELFSTAAKVRGCRGVVVDGLARDSKKVLSMGFPLFSVGTSPHDSTGRAKILNYGMPIRSGNVTVRPGDVVFADMDGVVVVPKEVEKETIDRAFEKAGKENVVRKELLQGKSLGEAWKKHHVL